MGFGRLFSEVWQGFNQGARTSAVPAMPGAAGWAGSMALLAACCRCACAQSKLLISCWTHVKWRAVHVVYACLKPPGAEVLHVWVSLVREQALGGAAFAAPSWHRRRTFAWLSNCTCMIRSCTEVRHHLHDSSGLRDVLRLCLARLLRQHLLRLRCIVHVFT